MQSKRFEGMTCPVADVVGALGDRWATLIMRDLMLGLSRYEELHQSTGITNATLSNRLKLLERNGLVQRQLYQSRPARYEYLTTSMGRKIGLVLMAMIQVGDSWNLEGLSGSPFKFIDTRSGRPVKLALVDAETDAAVRPQDVEVQEGPGADEVMQRRFSNLHSPASHWFT